MDLVLAVGQNLSWRGDHHSPSLLVCTGSFYRQMGWGLYVRGDADWCANQTIGPHWICHQ